MTNIQYSQDAELIKGTIYNTKVDDLELNGLLWSYLLVSANLSTFMPHLKADDHYRIIQNMQVQRSLSGIDLQYPSLLENTRFHDKSNVIEKSRTKGHIFVGFHSGPYNMMLRCLAEKSIPFCVVANKDYMKEYDDIVQKMYQDLPENHSRTLELFPAEDPRLLMKLTEKLNAGINICIFIDGNSGTKQNNFSEDKNVLKIDFLNHHIYARQGVAFLAYISKAPIVTVFARRDKDLNNIVKINLMETEDLAAQYKRTDFINAITKRIYEQLESYLVKNYEQWAGWFYIQNFFADELPEQAVINPEEIDFANTKLVVNEFIHLVRHNKENTFLVLKTKYEIMKISDFLYDVLTVFKTPTTVSPDETLIVGNEVIGVDFIKELIEMNFLKPVQ